MKKDLSESLSKLLNTVSDFVKSGTTALKNYNDTIELEKKQYEERQRQLQFQQFTSYTEDNLRKFIAETFNAFGIFNYVNPATVQINVTDVDTSNSITAIVKVSFNIIDSKTSLFYEFDERFMKCANNLRKDALGTLDNTIYVDCDSLRQKNLEEENRIFGNYVSNEQTLEIQKQEFARICNMNYSSKFNSYKSLYNSLLHRLYVLTDVKHHRNNGFLELHLCLHFDDAGLTPTNYSYLMNSRL